MRFLWPRSMSFAVHLLQPCVLAPLGKPQGQAPHFDVAAGEYDPQPLYILPTKMGELGRSPLNS
jgi:hypothetical protein